MIDIDKDYLITVDLKKSSVKSDRTIFFYNTDLNICNIFIKLICTDEDKSIPNDLVVELGVLKPESNEFKTLNATLISEEDLLYEVDLTTDYFDIVGKYECEIRISGTVDGEMKCLTSESFNYIVKPNITTKLDNEIKNDKNLPVLEKLIKDVKELSLGIETNQVQMKTDENLVGDNKTIVGAINQLREDVNSGIGGGTVDLTNYQKKNDETLNTTSKEIVGAINEVNTQFKDIANRIDNIVVTGGGLTTAQINALDNMFKVCVYTKDVSTEYNAFKTAFGIGTGTGGGDTPVEKTKYTITNNLTKVTTSNTATEIEEGSIYRANLTVDTSCRIDTITITMGGVDITNSCFTDNAIVINEVTGNIVITVVAVLSKVTAEDLGFTTLYEYDDVYDKDRAIASIGENGIVNYGYNEAVTVASYYYTVDNLSPAPQLITFDGRRFGSITVNENGNGDENSKVKKLKDTIVTSYIYKNVLKPKCYGCYTTGTNSGQINILSSQWQNITQTTDVDVHVRILIIQGTDITAEQLCTIFGI